MRALFSTLAAPLSALTVEASEGVPAASVPTKMRVFLYGTLKENCTAVSIGTTTIDSLTVNGIDLANTLWQNASEDDDTLRGIKLAINPLGDDLDAGPHWQYQLEYSAQTAIDTPDFSQLIDSAASLKRSFATNMLTNIVFTLRYGGATNEYSYRVGFPRVPDIYTPPEL